MTVAGAMFCEDYLLIAADSEATGPDRKFSVQKLNQHITLPLAWAFSGNESLGFEFSAWFRQYLNAELPTWDALKRAPRRKLAEINGEARRLKRIARVKIGDEETTVKVLIAAYIQGEPGILEFDDRAEVKFLGSSGFSTIGSGAVHAQVAIHALYVATGQARAYDEQMLAFALSVAIDTAPYCGHPVRMKKVLPDRVEDVNL